MKEEAEPRDPHPGREECEPLSPLHPWAQQVGRSLCPGIKMLLRVQPSFTELH